MLISTAVSGGFGLAHQQVEFKWGAGTCALYTQPSADTQFTSVSVSSEFRASSNAGVKKTWAGALGKDGTIK